MKYTAAIWWTCHIASDRLGVWNVCRGSVRWRAASSIAVGDGNCYLRNVLAIIIPQARDDLRYLRVIVIAVVLSCCFRYMPVFDQVSSGFAIIICAVVASAIGAVLYPIDEEGGEEA